MVVLKEGDLTSDQALEEKLAKERGMKLLINIHKTTSYMCIICIREFLI